MYISQINNSDETKYNNFVSSHKQGNIHQTTKWRSFQEKTKTKNKTWTYTIKENKTNSIIGAFILLKFDLPLGLSWLYSPRGPLIDFKNKNQTKTFFEEVKKIAREEKAVFLRIDPPILKKDESEITNFIKDFNLKQAHAEYMPENTLILNLQLSEEELLKQMKPKGRYNIKVATRHNVKVQIESINSIKDFYNLLKETTKRDDFSGHNENFYKTMLTSLGDENVKLWVAKYSGKPLATAIITYYKDTATYYFGASSSQNRNVMAPYLLHWEIIKHAKQNGYKIYDFFGISPQDNKDKKTKNKHPWASVSEFKLKFGGEEIKYIQAKELVFKPFWYYLIILTKKFKSCIRLIKK